MTDLHDEVDTTAPVPHSSWALDVLSDTPNRTILTALGGTRGRALSARALGERFPPETTPRLVRDRVRSLIRAGLVETRVPAAHEPVGAPVRWTLTQAGEEIVSLHALMARIASNGAGLSGSAPPELRERVIGATLSALADPVVVEVSRCLASSGPLSPEALEALCHPTPRRTLYRRLDQAVKGGAVLRETTRRVPRSTTYSLADRWRPAGTILLLAAWWEARHVELAGPVRNLDLEGLLLGIAPVCRVPSHYVGRRLALHVDDGDRGATPTLLVDGGRVTVVREGTSRGLTRTEAASTTVHGSIASWTAAIVNDRRDQLQIEGDAPFAANVISALRTALLSYIR